MPADLTAEREKPEAAETKTPPPLPSPPAPFAAAEPGSEKPSKAPPAIPWPGTRWWTALPAWVVSAVLHAAALLILALMSLTLQETQHGSEIVASQRAEPAEELETAEFETEIEELETSPIVSSALMADPGAAEFGDVALAAELAATDLGIDPIGNSTIGEIGNLFDGGLGMSTADSGQAVAYFFGVRTVGRRFVFVVDNSNSMNRGKFETACAELLRTVNQLDEKQQFYVIFFSDTAYPLFYPQSAEGMVPATEENKRKLEYWLITVQRCLRTEGREAMQMAFQLRPDAIYILGDGAFTDNTVDRMLSLPPQNVKVHTLGFRMKGKAKRGMKEIAQRFQGKFTDVAVPPPMEARSRQMNRPANRVRNGMWGVKLPNR